MTSNGLGSSLLPRIPRRMQLNTWPSPAESLLSLFNTSGLTRWFDKTHVFVHCWSWRSCGFCQCTRLLRNVSGYLTNNRTCNVTLTSSAQTFALVIFTTPTSFQVPSRSSVLHFFNCGWRNESGVMDAPRFADLPLPIPYFMSPGTI